MDLVTFCFDAAERGELKVDNRDDHSVEFNFHGQGVHTQFKIPRESIPVFHRAFRLLMNIKELDRD